MAALRPIEGFRRRLEERAFAPLTGTSGRYYLLVFALLLVVAWGVYAYSTQLRNGLWVTGMRDRISWGLYIGLFVFFIGISHAGTLISAILRVTKAGWRTPVTRMAELITLVALMVGGLLPMIDLGRPDRIPNLLFFGRWQSPIIWDFLAITTYLTGSAIYLYLPLIPDLARCRDALGSRAHPLRRWFFRVFSLNWAGTPGQKRTLESALTIMMIVIIPVAVSVHTVVSWIFAMTLREAWNNPMFGAYFVAGAIFSGIAALILLMALLRWVLHLEEYLTPKHFINLGYMLLALAVIMMYFNASEYVTTGYKLAGEETFHFRQLFTGPLAGYYWFYALGGMVLPVLIIALPWTRNLKGILVASALVTAGMWVERYFIVVGGLRVPLMPYAPASYAPTWVEWSIMAGTLAFFGLIIAIFGKLLPVISIWEVVEHEELASQPQPAPQAAAETVGPFDRGLQPEPQAGMK